LKKTPVWNKFPKRAVFYKCAFFKQGNFKKCMEKLSIICYNGITLRAGHKIVNNFIGGIQNNE